MSVDLILLSGFLGSGKTTLLLDFLASGAAADSAVIVNEVGEIGIDGVIVDDGSDGKVPMMMLANGCVCCSLRSSLVYTVASILDAPREVGAPPLRRIILETSGVSKPGPILASLADPELARRGLRINVVSTYDVERGSLNVETFEEAVAQLAAASRVVFTKVDKVAQADLQPHRERMARVNPLAQLVVHTDRSLAVSQAFAPLPPLDAADLAVQALSVSGAGHDHPRIQVLLGQAKPEISWDDMAQWLDDLAGGCGERLLRVKAIVQPVGLSAPVLIQSVGTTFSAPQTLSGQTIQDSLCVVIVRDLQADEINQFFMDPPITLRDSRAPRRVASL